MDDKKVVELTTEEYLRLLGGWTFSDLEGSEDGLTAEQLGLPEVGLADGVHQVLLVSEEYESEGREYNLEDPEDFETLRARTGMSSEFGEGDMIIFQNGMRTDGKGVKEGQELLRQITGQEVGHIHNDTEGLIGKFGDLSDGDVTEYVPNSLTLKDVLTAKWYEELSQNGERNLVVLHSAGNEDAYKAFKVLKLEDRNLGGNIDFMSVGSPRSERSLREAAEDVGGTVLKQYNDWKDPVTWGPAGMAAPIIGAGIATGVPTGLAVGAKSAAGAVTLLPALGPYAVPVAASVGFAAGAAESAAIYKFHFIESYINRDHDNLQTDLETWSDEHKPKAPETIQ